MDGLGSNDKAYSLTNDAVMHAYRIYSLIIIMIGIWVSPTGDDECRDFNRVVYCPA